MFKLLPFVAWFVVLAAAHPRLGPHGSSHGSLASGNAGLSPQDSGLANAGVDSQAGRSSLLSSSGSSIQHHLQPAQTLPLPLTISSRPGLHTVIAPETISIHQPTVARVGEVVQKIPTAVSHQSQTVVHKHARVVTPIVAPALRTITSQVVRAYHTPLGYAAHEPLVTVDRN